MLQEVNNTVHIARIAGKKFLIKPLNGHGSSG
jgi:hypothetical protein